MQKENINCIISVRGKVMAVDEYFPGTAARIWLKVDRPIGDNRVRSIAIPIACFKKSIYKDLKPLQDVVVQGHLEPMQAASSVLAVADKVFPLS